MKCMFNVGFSLVEELVEIIHVRDVWLFKNYFNMSMGISYITNIKRVSCVCRSIFEILYFCHILICLNESHSSTLHSITIRLNMATYLYHIIPLNTSVFKLWIAHTVRSLWHRLKSVIINKKMWFACRWYYFPPVTT